MDRALAGEDVFIERGGIQYKLEAVGTVPIEISLNAIDLQTDTQRFIKKVIKKREEASDSRENVAKLLNIPGIIRASEAQCPRHHTGYSICGCSLP